MQKKKSRDNNFKKSIICYECGQLKFIQKN